jgi:N-methylhydantoinase B
MDSNGLDDEPVPFEVVVEVAGSDITIDYTGVPDQQRGPINCPLPSTVSASRVAISMLAGGGEAPTEGHFRAIRVKTREGSMFHPLPPAPCYLYAWPTFQAIDAIYDAIAAAVPEAVPARSGGDICCLMWWGRRDGSNETWADGAPHPIGQGAHVRGDGESSLMHVGEPATRFPPAEVWEARNPWLLEKVELMQDSGGPGKYRGGLGADFHFHMLEDSYVTSVLERTKTPAFGREGGGAGRANGATIVSVDGTRRPMTKETAVLVPRGATLELHCGGGGGYGPPSERDPALVLRDVALGYVSEARARVDYPHAFADGSADAEQE